MGINDSVLWAESQENNNDLQIYSLATALSIPPSDASAVVRGNGFGGTGSQTPERKEAIAQKGTSVQGKGCLEEHLLIL